MTSRESRVFLGTVKAKKIGLETLLRASARGDGVYLYLPQDVCSVYGIMAGDRVKVKIVESFRLISGVEQEEPDSTREEKIEPTLVVPRRRGRPRKRKVEGELKADAEDEDESLTNPQGESMDE